MNVYVSVFIFCLVFQQEYLQDADKIARFFVSVSIGHPFCLNLRLVCFLLLSMLFVCFCMNSNFSNKKFYYSRDGAFFIVHLLHMNF